MNWFTKWPKDALCAVSDHFLGNFKIICTPEIKLQIIQVMGDVQDDVADTCVEYFNRYLRLIFIFHAFLE